MELGPVVPSEIQVEILEWVYRLEQSNDFVDRKTLLASSLVCKSWKPISQSLLFRRGPQILTEDDAAIFISILRENPTLGTYVRSLRILGLFSHESDKPRVNTEQTITLLGLCPQLLDLTFFTETELTTDELARIQALDLQLVRLQFPGLIRQLYEIAILWPTIRFMQCGVSTGPFDSVVPPQTGPPFTLEGVQIAYGTAEDSPFMPWLLKDSSSPFELEILMDLLASSSLGALATYSYRIRLLSVTPFPPQSILNQLPALEELIVGELPPEQRVLPQTVRHFGYHHRYTHWPPVLVERMDILLQMLRLLPDLRVVSATRAIESWKLLYLEQECRGIAVEFAIYRDWKSFPRAHNVDWLD
ncbi:hypothetical protein BV25DRAFT_716936 [Artomyces pyxidatus]|uniref:Uncharacterized protein n=1 Tax=Artomyces pyxidatus TaxID=48021 RepID=A0ACB8SZN3_9AGAM|nr:hypothetical protein BV25DRAFT_716936 [Artomyces pyxidatus]